MSEAIPLLPGFTDVGRSEKNGTRFHESRWFQIMKLIK